MEGSLVSFASEDRWHGNHVVAWRNLME